MEFSWKKMFLIAGIVIGPVVAAFILLSTPMMDTYHGWVKEDPKNEKSDWIDHKWLLLTIGDITYKTMRPEKAYLYYYDYLVLYPEDKEKRPYVLLQYANALNEANQTKPALKVYLQVIDEYEGDPAQADKVEAARQGRINIMYVKRK